MDSTSTQLQQRSVADWVHIIHNAASTDPADPNYAKSRRVMLAARVGLQNAVTTANEKTEAEALPGAAGAGVVNFGQGASAGFAQTQAFRTGMLAVPGGQAVMQLIGSTPEEYQDYLWKARMAQPGPSALGQGLGMTATGLAASPAVAPLGLVGGGAALAGTQVGVQTGIESDSPLAGVVAGVPAAVAGAIGGKIISKIPLARRVASSIMTRLVGRVPEATAVDAAEAGIRQSLARTGLTTKEIDTIVEGERLRIGRQTIRNAEVGPGGAAANDAGERLLRERLSQQGYPEGVIDKLVKTWREGGAEMETPAFQRTAERLGQPPRSAPTAVPTGIGNPPPNPALAEQYVKEANQRIADAAVRDATFTQAATEVPALQPKAAPLAASHTSPEVPPLTQYRMAVRQLEDRLGRDLTREESQGLMAQFFGKQGARPGHPFWLGGGTFTP